MNNSFKDYKQILNGEYIKIESFFNLETGEIETRVNELVNQIRALSNRNQDVFEQILKSMTELSIYKEALGIKMKDNKIPDAKSPERVYVQMRGALPLKKGERVWIGHYLGKVEEVCDENGEVLRKYYARGREAVVKKIVDRIKEVFLG